MDLLRRHVVDSDSKDDNNDKAPQTSDLCLAEFEQYINTAEAVDTGVDVVGWWGVCHIFYSFVTYY